MAEILGVYVMPHPPIIVPEVGKGEEKRLKKTSEALEFCSDEIAAVAPKTIIILTPHGNSVSNCFTLMTKDKLEGNLARFGAPRVSAVFECDFHLAKQIVSNANLSNLPCIELNDKLAIDNGVSTSLDWGAIVPLYFVLKKYSQFKLVHISVPIQSLEVSYKFGIALRNAVKSIDCSSNAVIICSGDLSHVLTQEGPYGYHPKGPQLDKRIIELISEKDVIGLLSIDRTLVHQGKECGLRSIIIGFGALDDSCFSTKVLSYEGPFGVGYAVACLKPNSDSVSNSSSSGLIENGIIKYQPPERYEDQYVALAKKSLEHYLKTGSILKLDYETLPQEMINKKAGVFVSLKKNGKLRGCIGTITPVRANAAEEVVYNAISAGIEDPRFIPVDANELGSLTFSVDVLSESHPITSIEDLDVKKFGIIIKSGRRKGILLPDLEGVNTPQEQIDIVLGKAGIRKNETYTIERFEVERHV